MRCGSYPLRSYEGHGSYPLGLQNKHPACNNNTTEASNNSTEAYTASHIISMKIQLCKTSSHPYLSSELQLPQSSPEQPDLKPAKPNNNANSGTQSSELRTGSYELNQLSPTLLAQQTALNKAQGKN
ncbi:hypothetical protein F511_24520 [Dorcoceras hygrometricum]|uniref:Uncharacterized protein n=1 Tax=Dorcoceras hygrometricum TaxID=472368 RepID=A0A2Z7B8Y6_9LAMI|nr:hypothetical protein F511_24520 [Dorcoceras hygrometricum]